MPLCSNTTKDGAKILKVSENSMGKKSFLLTITMFFYFVDVLFILLH